MLKSHIGRSHRRRARPAWAGSMIMSKIQRSNKESKKQSTLSAKERKAAKRDKKKSSGHVPFIIKDT
jgi:hypothetical protein